MSAMGSDWLRAVRVYVSVSVLAHIAWETLQLPLYTIWQTGSFREQAFAVAHCTGGDALILLSAIMAALILAGHPCWPKRAFGRVAALAIGFGVAYTAFSEWLNVSVRGSWAYAERMPILSVAGVKTGLSPVLQWLIVPAGAFAITRRVTTANASGDPHVPLP
jgi:hypothetical protein